MTLTEIRNAVISRMTAQTGYCPLEDVRSQMTVAAHTTNGQSHLVEINEYYWCCWSK
ncbi:Uncharacterised protein [Klebsiella pneumoniae]|nr:Uncharacterised protein [Klebsiella pneumoniae]